MSTELVPPSASQKSEELFSKTTVGKFAKLIPYIFGAIIFTILAKAGIFAVMANGAFDLFRLGAYGLGAYILYFIYSCKPVNKRLKLLYKVVAWHLIDKFWKSLDYETRMRAHIRELTEQLQNVDEQMANLSGFEQQTEDQIEAEKKKIPDLEATIRAALKDPVNNSDVISISQANLDLANEKIRDLEKTLQYLRNALEICGKFRRISNAELGTTKLKMDYALQKSKNSKALSSLVGSVRALLGGAETQEVWDAAMQQLEEETARNLGDYRNFVNSTAILLKKIDIQDKANIEKANLAMAEWERKSLEKRFAQQAEENGQEQDQISTTELPRVSATRPRINRTTTRSGGTDLFVK